MRIRDWSSDVCSSDLDSEAARLLLAAVTRQLRLADEADGAVADLHLDAVVGHLMHRAGHHVALLQLLGAAGEGILAELLDAEADALLVDVDVEHLALADVTLAVLLGGFLARQVPFEVGAVDRK